MMSKALQATAGLALLLASATASYECPANSYCPVPSDPLADCQICLSPSDQQSCESFDECICAPRFEKVGDECLPTVECPPNMTYTAKEDGFCCECWEGFSWEQNRCIQTLAPTAAPSESPSAAPTNAPSAAPTKKPTTAAPTLSPTSAPTNSTLSPTSSPSAAPSQSPTSAPTNSTLSPTSSPSAAPSQSPTSAPTNSTLSPTVSPSASPSAAPTTAAPTLSPTSSPTNSTSSPSASPSKAPSQSPTVAPTNSTGIPTVSPTKAPVMTLAPVTSRPTPSSFNTNITCEVWGDPHVDCFNGDQFSANPQASNNLTVMYTMGWDKFVVVGELIQTLNNNKWETYVETAYVSFNGAWVLRIRRDDCRPITPAVQTRAVALGESSTPSAIQEYLWRTSEEALVLNFTCPEGEGLDTFFNKMDYSAEAQQMGSLAWEEAQPGYGGDCLMCNYVPYNDEAGPVPRYDAAAVATKAAAVPNAQFDGVALHMEDGAQANVDDSNHSSRGLVAMMVVAVTLVLSLI